MHSFLNRLKKNHDQEFQSFVNETLSSSSSKHIKHCHGSEPSTLTPVEMVDPPAFSMRLPSRGADESNPRLLFTSHGTLRPFGSRPASAGSTPRVNVAKESSTDGEWAKRRVLASRGQSRGTSRGRGAVKLHSEEVPPYHPSVPSRRVKENAKEAILNPVGCFNNATPLTPIAATPQSALTTAPILEEVELRKRFNMAIRMNLPQKLSQVLERIKNRGVLSRFLSTPLNLSGDCALMIALWSGHVGCARVLLSAGAVFHPKDATKVLKSALLYGRACARSPDVIRLITECTRATGDLFLCDEDGSQLRDALVKAAIEMDPKLIRILFLKGLRLKEEELNQLKSVDGPTWQWLSNLTLETHSLRNLSRIIILRSIGFNAIEKINALKLPKMLQDYLVCQK